MKQECIWTHEKSNRNYMIVSDNARLKNPDTGEWVDCIIYSPLYENDYEMFAREKESFYKEFKKIEINNELLIKDLSARLPYNVIVEYGCIYDNKDLGERKGILTGRMLDSYSYNIKIGLSKVYSIRPYLRSMSSMTDEEKEDYSMYCEDANGIEYLLENHFDYRELIPKGLAIEVTEDNNPYK